MGKIFCIMGKSGCGKDTIFKHLKEDRGLNLNAVVPYTTRPKRVNETNGIEYHFITESMLEKYREDGKVIECREYDTVKGKWYYSTIDDGKINLNKGNFLLIVTLEAYENIRSYFGKENVIPFYIEVDDGVRLERALRRERRQVNPNYEELCRRFLADNADFSIEKLKSRDISKSYINDNLKRCINNIRADMLEIESF